MKTFQRFIAEAYRVSEISKQQVQEVAFLAPLAAGLARIAGGAAARGVALVLQEEDWEVNLKI